MPPPAAPQLRAPPTTPAEAARAVVSAPFEILTRSLNILNLTEQLMAEALYQLREARPLVVGAGKAYRAGHFAWAPIHAVKDAPASLGDRLAAPAGAMMDTVSVLPGVGALSDRLGRFLGQDSPPTDPIDPIVDERATGPPSAAGFRLPGLGWTFAPAKARLPVLGLSVPAVQLHRSA